MLRSDWSSIQLIIVSHNAIVWDTRQWILHRVYTFPATRSLVRKINCLMFEFLSHVCHKLRFVYMMRIPEYNEYKVRDLSVMTMM